jgi:S1-C subfamily serine protease
LRLEARAIVDGYHAERRHLMNTLPHFLHRGRSSPATSAKRRWGLSCAVWFGLLLATAPTFAQDWTQVNRQVQAKMAKIYGAGGVRGLEAYQSGMVISEEGHILTVWSYVLDTEELTVTLDDGRKFSAQMVGADPRLELAVLKVEANGLAAFDLKSAVSLQVGDRVLAFSNLYGIATGDEPTSILQGFVTAVTPLSARRGAYKSTYGGLVYVVDAMTNNAGAAGGALTDYQGNLAGMLGKELRSAQSNIWLNYALPMSEIQPAVEDILAGKTRSRAAEIVKRPAEPVTLEGLGLVLLPNVLSKTPPFIERVVAASPADRADLRPDDLVVMVNTVVIQSRDDLIRELGLIDRLDPVSLTLLRGDQLIPVTLTVAPTTASAP